jgi:hypothetical protein
LSTSPPSDGSAVMLWRYPVDVEQPSAPPAGSSTGATPEYATPEINGGLGASGAVSGSAAGLQPHAHGSFSSRRIASGRRTMERLPPGVVDMRVGVRATAVPGFSQVRVEFLNGSRDRMREAIGLVRNAVSEERIQALRDTSAEGDSELM